MVWWNGGILNLSHVAEVSDGTVGLGLMKHFDWCSGFSTSCTAHYGIGLVAGFQRRVNRQQIAVNGALWSLFRAHMKLLNRILALLDEFGAVQARVWADTSISGDTSMIGWGDTSSTWSSRCMEMSGMTGEMMA